MTQQHASLPTRLLSTQVLVLLCSLPSPPPRPQAASLDNDDTPQPPEQQLQLQQQEPPRQSWWKIAGAKVRQAGSAGLLAYGMLNAVYYSLAVSLLWVYTGGGTRGLPYSSSTVIAAVATTAGGGGGGGGVKATAQRFVKVLALAWAGSQVTKPLRAGGAVLLAPAMGRVMDSVQRRLRLKRRGDTVPVIIAALVLVTGGVFGALILQGTLADALLASASAAKPLAFLQPPALHRPLAISAAAAAATAVGTTLLQSESKPDVELNRHGKPKRRPKKQYLPPNPNVHGWDQHPAYLRGRWNVTTLAFAQTAMEDEWRATAEEGFKALVLKRDGLALLRGGVGNLTARGWEFTPANRRLLLEVALPLPAQAGENQGIGGMVLRLSGEVRRKPKVWCRATGTVRLRPAGSGKYQPHRALPSSDPAWPVVGTFVLERDMAALPPPSKWERVLVWLRLDAPRFSNTKAGRRAKAYLGVGDEEGDEEEGGTGEGKEWNARALKFEMWKYFK